MNKRTERASALPFAAVIVCLMMAMAMIVTKTAAEATVAARVQTAADAAALAGASGGEEAAGDAASANGARLLSYSADAGTSSVEVQIGDRTATARAKSSNGGLGASDGIDFTR